MKEGYLMIDHRASPGIPEDMARAMGFNPALTREGKIFETKTYTCMHCRGVVWKNENRVRERAFCRQCNAFICDGCHQETCLPLYSHVAYDQRVEMMQEWAEKGIMPGHLLSLT